MTAEGHEMNDTLMTIVGNVVDDPRLNRTKAGHWVANFRIASTPRRYDREAGAWIDGATLFVTVTCWRALAENVHQSLFKGQPVVVTGRYYQREYVVNEVNRTAYDLEATAIGHDLSRGVSTFKKMFRNAPAGQVDLDNDGIPADESGHYLDLDETPFGVDADTGEVLEVAAIA